MLSLASISTITKTTTHPVQFKIEILPKKKPENYIPYSIFIKLWDDNAFFSVPENFTHTCLKFEEQLGNTHNYQTFIFNCRSSSAIQFRPENIDIEQKKLLNNLFNYVKNNFLHETNVSTTTISSIDIILDMFAAQNDFTRPYKELYLAVKNTCKKLGIEVREPEQSFFRNPFQYLRQYWHW